ncbi:hypothetical protein HPB50_012854 [Hyalomma asiaticum]|uniref:Uncharacterized protein n=1 Tax=Hyalomma asiaticum TaxID=266040 RepID=A0ACB7RZN4_HYAAI|nr:hypothetical protein HPB50_012854 [Hyalomma asiaticum]
MQVERRSAAAVHSLRGTSVHTSPSRREMVGAAAKPTVSRDPGKPVPIAVVDERAVYSGYKTCTEKVAIFAAPREADHLKIWRHAIPRKDRVLQSTDCVCEKHFEPKYIKKTWEAVCKGHVLVSAPRLAALVKGAVPTKFPSCPAHLTNTEKKRKEPADRSHPPTTKRRRVRVENSTSFEELSPTQTPQACNAVSEMDQRVCVGSDAAVFDTTPVTVSATNLIEEVFENVSSAVACLSQQQHGLATRLTLTA